MKPVRWWIFFAGCLLAPLPPALLFWQRAAAWIVCPYALCVMFIRQAQGAYDSIGAAGIPDLLTALLQFPVMGWGFAKSAERGSIKRTIVLAIILHLAAVIAAQMLAEFRNRVWEFR